MHIVHKTRLKRLSKVTLFFIIVAQISWLFPGNYSFVEPIANFLALIQALYIVKIIDNPDVYEQD